MIQLIRLLYLHYAYVRRFHLQLLHGNFTSNDEAEGTDFRNAVIKAARVISDNQIRNLLIELDWRGCLTAAWFVGLSNRTNFIPLIRELLLASKLDYAGQGYCVTLALIGDEECRSILREYLRKYLPLNGRFYDQHWAIGALAHLEGVVPAEFLDQELWRESLITPEGIERFGTLIVYLRQHRMIE